MSGKQTQVVRELGKFVEAFWLELPLAVAKRALGNAEDNAVSAAGWKAYDALISLTNEATNRIYENPMVGALTGRAMESSLRAQQVGSTAASAVFSNLWPALGLPTASEVASLRSEIAALHEDISQTIQNVAAAEDTEESYSVMTDDGVEIIRNGYHKSAKDESDEDATN